MASIKFGNFCNTITKVTCVIEINKRNYLISELISIRYYTNLESFLQIF